ncbi:hypothetical protein ACFLYR_05035 [Chloroflexota bacterium]
MIKSEGFEYCVDCATGESHNLIPVGQQVLVPGKSRTEYTFFQCLVCGHVWQYVEDSGFGGHGHSYSLLTRP